MSRGHLSSDIISTLPQNIAETILSLMPIRDAVRTSILSRKWRYIWANIPKLVFNDDLLEGYRNEIFCAMHQIFLLHHGPLLEFSFSMDIEAGFEIDQIILHLSRKNTVQKFTLDMVDQEVEYRLPSSFFSMHQLTDLTLINCEFLSPSRFKGFSMLTSLYMNNVIIPGNMLLRLVSNCPVLKSLSLIINKTTSASEERTNIVEIFKSLPMIEHLCVCNDAFEGLITGKVPQKLPTPLAHLKMLSFNLYLKCSKGLDFALLVIRSSPNLEKIKVEFYGDCDLEDTDLPDQDYSDVRLDSLKKVEIGNFSNQVYGLELLKHVLAKSPMLKQLHIELAKNIRSDEELVLLRSLLRLPRASPVVDIVVEHYNPQKVCPFRRYSR